jgi:hypothetical protein
LSPCSTELFEARGSIVGSGCGFFSQLTPVQVKNPRFEGAFAVTGEQAQATVRGRELVSSGRTLEEFRIKPIYAVGIAKLHVLKFGATFAQGA